MIVTARDGSKYEKVENQENKLRFTSALASLDEQSEVLIIRTIQQPMSDKPSGMKRFFLLIPCLEEKYFVMVQITPAELLMPETIGTTFDEDEDDEETIEAIRMEVNSALKKIPLNEIYDPFEFSCGIDKALEVQSTKIRGKTASKSEATAKQTNRGRGQRRGSKFAPLVKPGKS